LYVRTLVIRLGAGPRSCPAPAVRRPAYGFAAPERTKTGIVSSVVVIEAVVPPAYRLPVK
jgi:hypothetical protein